MQRNTAEEPVEHASSDRPFDLVVVCTGNRARSPIAEAVLRWILADLPVRIRSLGTLDVGSLPPLHEAVTVAGAHGIDIRDHRSRCLRHERLDDADLVVGFETAHLAAATYDCHASPERVFSMLELVDLLDAIEQPSLRDPISRAREAVARAHALRTGNTDTPAEIADPLGGSPRLYRETVAQVLDASVRLAAGLFGASAMRPLPPASKRNLHRRVDPKWGRLRSPLT